MTESTRPHPRVAQYEVPGRRVQLSVGTLYISPQFAGRGRHPLIVHFHGGAWLLEHHVRTRVPQAALVTVQLGAGSRPYADALAGPGRFTELVGEARERLRALTGRRIDWDTVALSSFSAGYGAVRSILQQSAQFNRVDALLLADSLHASYSGGADAATPRAADLPVDIVTLEPFMRFARAAAEGRKRLIVTHSEVFPGTYASTTETADVLLGGLGLSRRPVLRPGPIGMQQLSEARRGAFHLAGYAGNSAPDHMDHLYGLGEHLAALTRPLR